MMVLHDISPSRTVRVSMSGREFNSTEYRPRPWLCSARHAVTCWVNTSATTGSQPKSMYWSTVFGAARVTRFSFCSAPGVKVHTAEAQLPAYCRMAGRKDTRSGRKLPSTGKKHSPINRTNVSHGDDMSQTA